METRIDGREKAARRELLEYLFLSVLGYLDSGADSGRIRAGAAELHRQVVIPVDLARVTSVDRGGRVDVAHHEIEIAAVVQIDVSRAVRESRLREPPFLRDVSEFQTALIHKRV